MAKRNYGKPPWSLGRFACPMSSKEMMCYLYLPIIMKGNLNDVRLPNRLQHLDPIIQRVVSDVVFRQGVEDASKNYVYLTAKTLFVEQGNPGNRPGWHADGYGSDGDLNYVWYNRNPTEFAVQEFDRIPDDDTESMKEMERQIIDDCIRTYDNGVLLGMDEDVVHRVNPVVQSGMRTFIKLSVSRHKYNLQGNSHNYLFDYSWEMVDRNMLRRNCDNKDFAKTEKSS